MGELLIIATSGAEDPTRASFPFFLARAASNGGREVAVVLAADSSPLASRTIRESVHGVGFPPLEELYSFARENGIPVYL